MRTSLITLLAMTAATGCATSADYAHTAEFYVQARGVAYTDDASAQVGMYGVTCAINPSRCGRNSRCERLFRGGHPRVPHPSA